MQIEKRRGLLPRDVTGSNSEVERDLGDPMEP